MKDMNHSRPDQLNDAGAIYQEQLGNIRQEIAKVIVGQHKLVEAMLCTMMAQGHMLLEGVPGLAKSLAVATFSHTIGGDYSRIQFTPDKLPSDITGTMIYDESTNAFVFHPGPVFCNLLLADEINRASPKVQSALLEAMQEQAVSVDRDNYPLPELFMVLATQNPVEQLGTYPLSEAQLDRFMVKINITYPQTEHEMALLNNRSSGVRASEQAIEQVLCPEQVNDIQNYVAQRVSLSPVVVRYILEICQQSRPESTQSPGIVKRYIKVGVSPRAGEHLVSYCKAYAFVHGRHYVCFDDVDACVGLVLGHRLVLSDTAIIEGKSGSDILMEMIESVPPYGLDVESRFHSIGDTNMDKG